MHIGILQTGHMAEAVRHDTGDYNDMFVRLLAPYGLSFTTWDVEASDMPADPEAAEGWLITGSRHGAYEDHPWIAPLEALVRRIVAARRPLIGICFGHQIVAQALGGTVERFAGGWSVGPTAYDREDGTQVVLTAWHRDQVTTPPAAARTIASNDFCAHAAFLIGDTTLTWQPHPEYGSDALAALIAHRGASVEPERLAKARERLAEVTDRRRIGAEMAAFFRATRSKATDVA